MKQITKKRILDDNLKSYNLWDQITIENQKTKEIRENIKHLREI